MAEVDFSNIASRYEKHSLVQKSAAERLLNLLDIGENDSVLDVGCGIGNITMKIRELTNARMIGIDPSEGMIKEALKKCKGSDILFEVNNAEEMDYNNCFDVIFCNSAFQWFKDPKKAIKNCYAGLRKGGRIGIQAPAKKIYSPNFIEAVGRVKDDPITRNTFSHHKEPWFFLETSDEYSDFFEKSGFNVVFSKIDVVKTKYTPEEVFNVFSSGAMMGYLGQEFYDIRIDEDYIEKFKEIVKDAFIHQANDQGKVELIFNRIFLVATKE